MTEDRRVKTKRIALGGVLLALLSVVLFITSISPVNRLSLYVLSSFFVSIVVTEAGIKAGWLFYAASLPLCFLVMRDFTASIPYILFFGVYGLIKFHIERIRLLMLEVGLKIFYFCMSMGILYISVRNFFLSNVKIALPLWALAAILFLAFLAYDYVYTLLIGYYSNRIRKRIGS